MHRRVREVIRYWDRPGLSGMHNTVYAILNLLNHKDAHICFFFIAAARQARSARALKIGTLRPAIVLYDEPHPLGDDIGSIQSTDITRKPDMLIIMGTSLKVHGFKKLVKDFAKTVRESAPPNHSPMKSPKGAKSWAGKVIFVNKSAPGSEWDGIIDYHVEGETDKWCEKVIEDWKKARPADWEVQTKLDATGGEEDLAGFKVMKEMTNATGAKQKGQHCLIFCMFLRVTDEYLLHSTKEEGRSRKQAARSGGYTTSQRYYYSLTAPVTKQTTKFWLSLL